MTTYELYCDDCVNWLIKTSPRRWDTAFCDPPDNLGLKYGNYKDKLSEKDYIDLLRKWLKIFVEHSRCVWFSYNAKWTFQVGKIVTELEDFYGKNIKVKPCVQVFTFGQHNQHDLANCHRPLIRITWNDAPLYPDAIRVSSWRQLHGDKRADPRGRIPSDVFDIPRVTGNSHQRRTWHPTQLSEKLIERCLKLTCKRGDYVLDLFSGTGTTLRVCQTLGLNCTAVEYDYGYCEKIAKENGLVVVTKNSWSCYK